MKKLFLIALLPLASCIKEWKCTTSGEYAGVTFNTPSTFKGSKSDMHDYEAKNTTSYAVTVCK